MKEIVVQKEFVIPGTNVVLEKGDSIVVRSKKDEASFQAIPKEFRTFSKADWSGFAGASELAPGIPPLIYEGTVRTQDDVGEGPGTSQGLVIISGDESGQGREFHVEVYTDAELEEGGTPHMFDYMGFSKLCADLKHRFQNGVFNYTGYNSLRYE
jgi:hypothetical protein